jgi:predicted PhzF superfamily epimerase YddE/YHI9
MKIALFQVDAFTSGPFSGNPAAVCPLIQWLPDAVLQGIAQENNLSETAFIVDRGERIDIRWFTPTIEVELCGHATLASAHVVLESLGTRRDRVEFSSRSGPLIVERHPDFDEMLVLDFPSLPAEPCRPPPALVDALGAQPAKILLAKNYLAVFENEAEVRGLAPDFRRLADCHPHAVIATAPAKRHDFVSRFFAPSFGIDEDPATGAAHCTLVPYWADRLEKRRLRGYQASRRGAEMFCENRGARVGIGGRCRLYLKGTIYVDA